MSQLRKRSRDTRATPGPAEAELANPTSVQSRGPSKLTLAWTLICALLSISILLFYLRGAWIPYFSRPNTALRVNKTESEGSSFRLHPADHVYREPATIRQTWEITSGPLRPDGVLKRVYLINDQFPGPTVEARSGDRVIIEVTNALEDEDISIHWHGLSMRGANDMDGAVGITNKAVAPGEVMIYDFQIEYGQHGTFFYHAHDGVQRAEGLYGAFIVHQPWTKQSSVNMDSAHHLVTIGDWYHRTAEDALDFYMHPGSFGNEAVPDSILLNGNGAFNCSDAVPARPLDCEQRYLQDLPSLKLDGSKENILHIVNAGAYAGSSVSIPGATLLPIAVDGGNAISCHPAKTIGDIQPGERVDVVVKLTEESTLHTSTLEVSLDTTPFKYPNPALTPTYSFPVKMLSQPDGAAADDGASLERLDLENVKSSESQVSVLPKKADKTFVLYTMTQRLAHLENVPRGFINHTSWTPQSTPLTSLDQSLWDKNQFVPHIDYISSKPLWVDIVLNNLDEESHPFHLHGHDFWVLSTYSSTFNWGSYNPFEDDAAPGGEYDLIGAVKRDTVNVPRRGYAVLRFKADNPGIWMFHCHVLWHLASGMAMAFEVGRLA